MDRLFECALFVVGLVFGSFLNVCISRLPRDESVISPPSHCPHCGTAIRWYDNIPLLSWTFLGGRCRSCRKPISLRYPVVELLTGVFFAASYVGFGCNWMTLKFCVFCFLLIGLIFMDAETGLLPREFTYGGIALGLALAWVAHTDSAGTAFLLRLYGKNISNLNALSLLDAALGALLGAGFFYFAWALYYLARKKHGIGFGDVALMGMAGAFLGLKLIVLVIVLAPMATVLYALFLLVRDSFQPSSRLSNSENWTKSFLGREIPFGVFLGACSLLASFAGEAIWRWYLGFF